MKIFFIILFLTGEFVFAASGKTFGLELRAIGGTSQPKAEKFNDGMSTNSDSLSMKSFNEVGADLIIYLPVIPFGFGVRGESGYQTQKDSLDFHVIESDIDFHFMFDYKWEILLNRTAVLLNYRIINTVFFLGPIVTIGASHTGYFNQYINGVLTSSKKVTKGSSSSAGIELGIELAFFHLGVEGGFRNYLITDPFTANALDMSGSYMRGQAGFSF